MKSLAFSIAAGLLVLSDANADVITWDTPQEITATTDVVSNGPLVTALNMSGTTTDHTVNGTTFTPFIPPQWDGGGGTLLGISTTGSFDFDEILRSARTVNAGPSGNPTGYGPIQLDTLGTLQMGRTYTIQVFYSDQRFGFPRDRVMNFSSVAGALTTTLGIADNLGSLSQGPVSLGVEADPNNFNQAGDTVHGSYCVGTFTRTSNDPLYLLVEGTHPDLGHLLRPHISAVVIRDGAPSLGSNYCGPAVANSTGGSSTMSATGTNVVTANNLTITSSSMPANQFGIFVTSQTQDFIPMGGGSSNGNICLGGAIGRFFMQNQILSTGATGEFSLLLPLNAFPQGNGFVQVVAGETWNFQAWHRDSVGLGSNFSDGLTVTFQ